MYYAIETGQNGIGIAINHSKPTVYYMRNSAGTVTFTAVS